MPSFASALETTLHKALEAASSRRHEYATLEHLLLALVDDEHASKVMSACGVEPGDLKMTVAHYLDTELEALKVEAATDPDGPMTKSFEAFASSSADALTDRAATSASAFDDASAPLGALRLVVALAGVAVALLAVSGYGQRLREYR